MSEQQILERLHNIERHLYEAPKQQRKTPAWVLALVPVLLAIIGWAYTLERRVSSLEKDLEYVPATMKEDVQEIKATLRDIQTRVRDLEKAKRP